jgi:thymidylate kinase
VSEENVYKVKVGDKEIEINEEVLGVLRRYVHTEMSLEQLASELGLESWEEAYEFVKKIPAWILWIPPSLWKTLKRMKRVTEELKA